jgi:ABC-type bacteriocin/lantibiotic exporter with double-glycine peptidase domain
VRTIARRGRYGLPERIAVVVCLVAAGCASRIPRSATDPEASRADGWALVDGVPEVRQTSSDGCGAAALAMVLGRWGLPVTEEEIRAASPPASGQGIRADALRDFAKSRGLQAFLVQGRSADLEREVGRNRPVLVGVMKRRGPLVYPHYEVVVGVNPRRQRILTLDPARGPTESSMERFAAEWAAANELTLVVLPRPPSRATFAAESE